MGAHQVGGKDRGRPPGGQPLAPGHYVVRGSVENECVQNWWDKQFSRNGAEGLRPTSSGHIQS
eukprot:scaffold104878_cov25-Prasinocladus_malaysianus.AAC.1